MKFYRRLAPFKAISFDLDDTLYSNHPIMMSTSSAMLAYFQKELPLLLNDSTDIQIEYNIEFWSVYKEKALNSNPELKHDVGTLRNESYYLGMIDLGLSKTHAREAAQKAMDHFNFHRSNFTVPDNIHRLLSELAKKWPLIAISNGNVNTRTINLNQYFSGTYHAGEYFSGKLNKHKPCPDMFNHACSQLDIQPSELLHVGDCGKADILGGILAGCQTAWVSSYDVGKPLSILPNIELSDVEELHQLLV
jgi:putative hydrolase of the HAD superfamily